MSESQERMMAIVRPEHREAFLAITTKWDVEASVLGTVTTTGRLVVRWHGETIVDVPPRTVAHDGPVYHRPFARPDWMDTRQQNTSAGLPRPVTGEELRATVLALVGSANLASRAWITDQYDRYVLGNTASAMPDDAGVVRVDEESGLGVAISTDCNGRFAALDPYQGAQLALAEAYRNVAVAGAKPLAVTDCLNFGSPEDPGVMWQFERAVTGLADGCVELGVPVTGGNVSLYNQTGDTAIHPTPVVGVLGVIHDVATRNRSGWNQAELVLFQLGQTRDELDGSEWAWVTHQHLGGTPPLVDLAAEHALASVVLDATARGWLAAAHDLSEGGLAQGLVEGSLRFGVGAQVDLNALCARDGVDAFVALFSESSARVVVAVQTQYAEQVEQLAHQQGVPCVQVGVSGGDAVSVAGAGLESAALSVPLAQLRTVHTQTIPAVFEG